MDINQPKTYQVLLNGKLVANLPVYSTASNEEVENYLTEYLQRNDLVFQIPNWLDADYVINIFSTDTTQKVDLHTSLGLFEKHLNNPTKFTPEDFEELSAYNYIGCFCEPNNRCHLDILRQKLEELNLPVPERQCVKVKYLRRDTPVDNLREWCEDPVNKLCTRRGRVFINKTELFHYPESKFCNPYKVK